MRVMTDDSMDTIVNEISSKLSMTRLGITLEFVIPVQNTDDPFAEMPLNC